MNTGPNPATLDDMPIDAAAEAFFSYLVAAEGTGTALVSAACVAGAQLMRNAGLSFEGMEPGSYVLFDALNDSGIAMLNALDTRLAELESEPIDGWNLPELEGTGPAEPLLVLTAKHEAEFVRLAKANGVAPADRPLAAMRAAALIIHRAAPVLQRELGTSVFAQALVPSVKSVPPALTE